MQLIVTWSPTLNPATAGDEEVLEQLVGTWAFACTVSPDGPSKVIGPLAMLNDGTPANETAASASGTITTSITPWRRGTSEVCALAASLASGSSWRLTPSRGVSS